MKFDFKGNLKKGFTAEMLLQDLYAGLTAVVYRTLPSLLGLNGWLAWLVGTGVPYAFGKVLNVPAVSHAAIACGAAHAVQFLEPQFRNLTGKSFWTLTTNEGALQSQTAIQDNMGAMLRPGQNLFAYNPDEIRALAQSPMNDRMGEVINTANAKSDMVITPHGQIMSQPSPFVQQNARSPFSSTSLY